MCKCDWLIFTQSMASSYYWSWLPFTSTNSVKYSLLFTIGYCWWCSLIFVHVNLIWKLFFFVIIGVKLNAHPKLKTKHVSSKKVCTLLKVLSYYWYIHRPWLISQFYTSLTSWYVHSCGLPTSSWRRSPSVSGTNPHRRLQTISIKLNFVCS